MSGGPPTHGPAHAFSSGRKGVIAMILRIAIGLACILALAGLGVTRSHAADEAAAGRVPTPVIHSPADNRVTVNVDDYGRGDDYLAITEALAEVKRKRAGRLVFAKRTYRITNPKAAEGTGHLVLDGLQDLTIDGNGCTLLFHAIETGVFVNDCKRILVRNVNVDWDRLLSSAGVVEENEGKQYVRIATDYDVAGLPLKDIFEFDVEKRHWLGSFAMQTIPAATQVEKGLYLLPNTYLAAGSRVAVRHAIYDAYGFFVTGDTNDIAFENIEVRQTPGIGFMVAMAGRGFRFSDVRLARTNKHQLLTTMADVIHLNSTKGDILIERCDFSSNGDDAVAISTLVTRVKQIEGEWVWLKYPLVEEYGIVPPLYAKGDTLGFLDEGTRRLLGRAVVEDVVQDGMALVVRLRKDGDFELPLESLCGNFTRRAERVAIRDNRFHDHRGRGVYLSAKDVCIESNVMENLQNAAVIVTAESYEFFMGFMTENVVIRGNRFIDAARDRRNPRVAAAEPAMLNITAVAGKGIPDDYWKAKREKGIFPQPSGFAATCEIKHIVVEDNLFSTSPSMAILVTAAEDVAIRNNRFENVGYARDPQAGRAIDYEYPGEISVVGTYDDVTVEGSTWIDMDNDHELVWFEQPRK
jgi:hypothetical protein